jgi:hypothetical protein
VNSNCSAADREHFDADPRPTFRFHSDPDSHCLKYCISWSNIIYFTDLFYTIPVFFIGFNISFLFSCKHEHTLPISLEHDMDPQHVGTDPDPAK